MNITLDIEALCPACVDCRRLELDTVNLYADDVLQHKSFVCAHLKECKITAETLENERKDREHNE